MKHFVWILLIISLARMSMGTSCRRKQLEIIGNLGKIDGKLTLTQYYSACFIDHVKRGYAGNCATNVLESNKKQLKDGKEVDYRKAASNLQKCAMRLIPSADCQMINNAYKCMTNKEALKNIQDNYKQRK